MQPSFIMVAPFCLKSREKATTPAFHLRNKRFHRGAGPGDLILTVGAGDIFTVGESLVRES